MQRGSYLLGHASLLLGRLLLGHAGGLSTLGLGLGGGDLLGGSLALDGGRRVDDGDDARLGVARGGSCFASHV